MAQPDAPLLENSARSTAKTTPVVRGCCAGGVLFFLGMAVFGWLPRMNEEIRMEENAACQDLMYSIDDALERYGAEQKRFPSALGELSPKYLSELPKCPTSPTGYVYISKDKNHFSLSCDVHSQPYNVFERSLGEKEG